VSFSQNSEKGNSTNSAQQKQIAFRDVTVTNGLSQNSVVSIAQDSIGYLWFATQDGLNRYDGKTFKYYNKQFTDITRPTFSKLGKVYVDAKGDLWITTIAGHLERYNKAADSFSRVSSLEEVSTMFQDNASNFYVGTYGKGLFKITDQDTVQVLKSKHSDADVFGFYSDTQTLYSMTSKGLLELHDSDYTVMNANSPQPINYSSMAQVNNTNWVGSFGNGLYELTNSKSLIKFEGFNVANKLPKDLNILSLLPDANNRLWIATYGNGAYLLDFEAETVRHFMAQKNNPFALHYNDILCLYQDFTGTIWFGTDGAGLSYYDENLVKFNILTNNQTPRDISVDVIRAISVDSDKTIWLGTSGKGLTRYNSASNSYATYTTSNSGITSNRIMSLLNTNDDLWIGFQGEGLNILNASGQFQSFKVLDNKTIWKIYKDSANKIWLCTRDNGLLQFDKNKGILTQFNTTTTNGVLLTNNIRTIEEGSNQELYIGTDENGLYVLEPKSKKLQKIPKIPDNIKSLHYSKNKILWVGTNGNGLKAYNTKNKSVTSYNRDTGLPNNVIYGVLADSENKLWLSSNKGVTVLNTSNGQIVNYNDYDGLQALEFNTGAYFKDFDGYLYFGGLEGVNWFKPNALTKNPIAPKTVITDTQIFGTSYNLEPKTKLKHNENTISFTFAGLHYSLPERNNYQYKLDNYDTDWIASGNINKAQYSKLPPDDYVFKVKSSNYDAVWNQTPTELPFTIKQPWYFNSIAKGIYALLILGSIFGIYRYLKWRWYMKMQLQLEHNEAERLKKLDEFKSRLYTNISHEFRTPLTLISGPIERQLSKPELSEEDQTEFSLIQRNSKRLLNLVNQLLDLSKLESGSLKLAVAQGDLNVLLKQIAAAFQYKAEEKQIDFNYKISPIETAWFDKDIIEKIVTNLLANAIKYTPNRGRVNFETLVKDGQLIITIINNGNRISDEELAKLFRRFYQSDKNSDGAGIGLSLVKELCILSHGNVVAHTMNEDDIQFTVTLPIERSFYNQSEIVFETETASEVNNTTFENALSNASIDELETDQKPVLLIIEDDTDVRQFVVSIFKKDYKIYEATNGKNGIEAALKHVPDLIISDIMMPITDGIEVCNTLKHDERTSHIPIILLTAKVGEENEIEGLKTGADAYITKPFSSNKLIVIVEKLIQIRRQLQERYSKSFEINSKEITVSSVDEQFLERLQIVLDDNITNPEFSVEEFCEKMIMSRMQLHRKLKALTGLSTTMFLRSQRLKLAADLLKKSDYTVSEIAYEVGFNTPSYFIKCFKDTFKCTPSEYAEKA